MKVWHYIYHFLTGNYFLISILFTTVWQKSMLSVKWQKNHDLWHILFNFKIMNNAKRWHSYSFLPYKAEWTLFGTLISNLTWDHAHHMQNYYPLQNDDPILIICFHSTTIILYVYMSSYFKYANTEFLPIQNYCNIYIVINMFCVL